MKVMMNNYMEFIYWNPGMKIVVISKVISCFFCLDNVQKDLYYSRNPNTSLLFNFMRNNILSIQHDSCA